MEPAGANMLMGRVVIWFKAVGVALLAALAVYSGPAFAAELNVTVSGLRSGLGKVYVALYDDAGRFPKDGEYLADAVVSATMGPAGKVTVVFKNLATGKYALAAYHDENGNDEFDQGILGVPLEGYGFSNGTSAFFGPPDFSQAAVILAEPASNITIRMTYW